MAALAILPLALALIYILAAYTQGLTRYDERFFTPVYQETYDAPSDVTRQLEQVLQSSDQALYQELTGLRGDPEIPDTSPHIIFTILLDVDERDYFHYLYFNTDTYERLTFFLKKVKGRWIVVPQDAYFFYDSGQWVRVFTPLALVYWIGLLATFIVVVIYRATNRMREEMF